MGTMRYAARRTRRVAAALVVATGALMNIDAPAQESRARTDVQWIQSMRQAAQKVNYAGTIIYQAGGEMRSSRITHLFDGTESHERIQTLDGKPREYIRRRSGASDQVQCLIPESRRIVIEKRSVEESFPGLSSASPEEILERYTLTVGGVERVAGIECQLLTLEPKDNARYGYRLWVDRASGLLLKAQTLNERREVIEQIAFSDVRIGEKIDRAKLRPSWSTEGWSVERSDYHKADLSQHGWLVPTPTGFRKTREVARRIAGSDAMQAVFSDGLATVSVFIQPHSALAASGAPAAANSQMPTADALQIHGPTSAYSRRVGDSLVTVVGEVPPSTVRAVAGSVEFRGSR
ncbi:MAG TPA: MucB/RseB C-terminal domain-containing protein [Burkholderiaceae bacterium]|nr:MucB/RseB C-terminal domain-containing protein [Burkholderiaceae bacterium]